MVCLCNLTDKSSKKLREFAEEEAQVREARKITDHALKGALYFISECLRQAELESGDQCGCV